MMMVVIKKRLDDRFDWLGLVIDETQLKEVDEMEKELSKLVYLSYFALSLVFPTTSIHV